MKNITHVVFLIFIISNADCICNLPADLTGNWISADKGIITFSNNGITNYPIDLSASVSTMDFGCETLSDGQYYLSLTPDKYYYYVATTIEPTINERIYVKSDSTVVTHTDVCNRQKPFEIGTYVMLIREGGSGNCSGSQLDTCADKTAANFTYSSCSNSLTYTDGGEFRCLYYKCSGELTYLALWNVDTTVTDGQTHRFVCYVMYWHRGSMKTTAYPGSCHAEQTATAVESPGVIITMTDVSVDCDPEKGFDLVPYYVGAIALALLIIGCVGVCVSYYHYKKADKINRVHTIRVKEKKQEHINRESSSGVFSYGSFDDDFRNISTSTPEPPQNFQYLFMPIGAIKSKEVITKPTKNITHQPNSTRTIKDKEKRTAKQPTNAKPLSKVLDVTKAKEKRPLRVRPKLTSPPTTLTNILISDETLKSGKNYDDISDNFHNGYPGKGEMKQLNVQTAEDFYRNQELHGGFTHLQRKHRKRRNEQNSNNNNINSREANVHAQSAHYFTPTHDRFVKFSERHNIYTDVDVYKPKTKKSVKAEGPDIRGQGTNTVHYFDRRIPMHWKY